MMKHTSLQFKWLSQVQKLKELIDDGASISAAAREVGMSRVTAYKYLAG